MKRAGIVRIVIFSLAAIATAAGLGAYVTSGASWPSGSIVMHEQLGTNTVNLIDGSTSWNQAAEGQLATWNQYLSRSAFTVVRNSTVAIRDGDGVNNVFWDSDVYGTPFGANVLAVTRSYSRGGTKVESDVVFNTAYSWNAYTGNRRSGIIDIRRVALHEFGHVLGLLHPDDYGQSVSAIMHSSISDLYTLTADDIAGVQSIYGGSSTGTSAPGAPSGLTASASGGTVTLRWSAPSSGGTPTGYTIEAGSSPGLTNLANAATGSSSTTFTATGVGAGVYYVRVRASNAAGVSGVSNEVTLVVGSGCAGAPTAPSGLSGSASGSTVTLSWAASGGGATTYIVEAGSGPGLSNLANSDLGSSATSLVAPGVGPGTYYVRVRGKNACGTGPVSNEITVVVR